MQIFESKQADPDPSGTIHVALLDGDGTPFIHEELTKAEAPHRHHMLELQAELDVRDIPNATRRVYIGQVWPPEGHEVKKGKIVAVKVEP
jgi:hypothetical protein